MITVTELRTLHITFQCTQIRYCYRWTSIDASLKGWIIVFLEKIMKIDGLPVDWNIILYNLSQISIVELTPTDISDAVQSEQEIREGIHVPTDAFFPFRWDTRSRYFRTDAGAISALFGFSHPIIPESRAHRERERERWRQDEAETNPSGQLALISFQTVLVNNQPRPGKKSLRCKRAGREQRFYRLVKLVDSLGWRSIFWSIPLSFHADIHHIVLSIVINGYSAWK